MMFDRRGVLRRVSYLGGMGFARWKLGNLEFEYALQEFRDKKVRIIIEVLE